MSQFSLLICELKHLYNGTFQNYVPTTGDSDIFRDKDFYQAERGVCTTRSALNKCNSAMEKGP